MAHKHELMARLRAARQSSGKILEIVKQTAYPEETENKPMEIPPLLEEIEEPQNIQASSDLWPVSDPLMTVPHHREPGIPSDIPESEADQALKRGPEKTCYTTISVPKQYGQKAKLYATLLNVNMVEFTCGALDSYILQLQEEGKLPRVNL